MWLIRGLSIVLVLSACQRHKAMQRRSAPDITRDADAAAASDVLKPPQVRTPVSSLGIPQSQLGWDGTASGATKTLYVIPVE